uniref:RNA-directed DNA polymerase n=1 Tax=Peronospora matthiolae TaxID=2874970 RepID=A0AAV1VD68_9STRA
MEIELAYGESRGYWKHYSPGKWFKQAKAVGKINNVKATLLFDSGAEVSIIDTTFAREVGCNIDESQRQECIGIGETPYMTVGRTKIKVTLAGSLVYYFNVWVGDLAGQEAILGMDFMVPAGVRLDLADGALCLPEEIRIHLAGRRPAYGSKIQHITAKDQHVVIPVGESREVKIGIGGAKMKLWVARGLDWVPTVISGWGKTKYLQMTNIGDREIILPTHTILGMWVEGDMVPRTQGLVTVGSGKYKEWQTLAYEATTDRVNELPKEPIGPLVDRPTYAAPKRILKRPSDALQNLSPAISTVTPQANDDDSQKADAVVARELTVRGAELSRMENGHEIGTQHATKGDRDTGQEGLRDRSSLPKAEPTDRLLKLGQPEETKEPKEEIMLNTEDVEIAEIPVYHHESGDLFAEDIEQHMAVLPEMSATTEEVTIEDIQIGDPDVPLTTDQQRLRSLIWKSRHLLMGKGNALPPAARGAICDIDVGGAAPIAQRARPVAPKYREKLSDLIKGLLAAKIVQPSTSPWASPIVVIIKKNGVDIRLCIDYRRVNQLTRLMVYPMPLISDLLEDLDKALWYCSLDMASGFWVVEMTERAKLISAFVTPFGLFEWLRMPFGLKNAPQIYQRLVDNALYGYLKIGQRSASDGPIDVFKDGEPETDRRPSILGRRSYIDDILIPATSWGSLYTKVERLLEACDKWNLSISLTKSFWGCRKVDYLGHRVSMDGLEAQPKNLESLVNIPFPSTLRAMQSFLGSLNYYRRFIEDFAVYAAVLYELRESDFFEIGQSQLAAGDECSNKGRWTEAKVAFTMLKAKIATAPMLKHFDPDRSPVIVVYASKWAVSAALIQEYDGVYHPVTFTSRTLKPNELNYGTVEKEVLALLRVLDVCYTTLASREITVLTRHSTLAWLMQSRGLNGRLGRWAALLSNWTMEVKKCERGEEEILGMLAASITPRGEVEEMLIAISPRKDCRLKISMPLPTLETDEELLVASFDGSARIKKKGGSFSAVIWKLPEWTIVAAESRYVHDLTVNEAEYNGLLLCFELLADLDRGRVILCGDSSLVIRQMRGEIDCKAPGLQLLRHKALEKLRSWPSHEFLHVKRE